MTNGPKQFDLSRPISLTCRFILRLEVKRAHLKIESFDLKGTPTSRFGFSPIQIFIQRVRQIRSDGNIWDIGIGDHLYSLDSTSAQSGPQVGGSSFYLRD